RAHAAFVLRERGEQALANVLRVAELARTYEAAGSISFRGFVERLREEAEGEAPEAPIVEESSEGVRVMTVHKAKGLEFPVVVLADITCNIAAWNPGRWIDAERGLCALRLGGWQPWDLLEHADEEGARDRAEGVRVAYVAATRARDLLVVPAIGDDPFAGGWDGASDGWISPVHAAIYPPAERRRASQAAPGCPAFGEDSVLERSDRDTPGRDNVRPGLHAFAEYDVAWWDPRALAFDVQRVYGLRRDDLIVEPAREVVDADRKRYDEWLAARREAQEAGARPSLRVRVVTEWAGGPLPPRDAAGVPRTRRLADRRRRRPGIRGHRWLDGHRLQDRRRDRRRASAISPAGWPVCVGRRARHQPERHRRADAAVTSRIPFWQLRRHGVVEDAVSVRELLEPLGFDLGRTIFVREPDGEE